MRQLKIQDKPGKGIESLAFDLLNSVTVVHIAHLGISGVGSYAAHKAMQGYYEDIGDLADALVESYQGLKEKLITLPTTATLPKITSASECVSYLKNIRASIDNFQQACDYSEINNILDEIKGLIDSTCYKLTFLK